MSDNNPYSKAAAAYGSTAATADPRSLEGQVLLNAATKLEALSKRIASGENVPLADISGAVDFNRKLWTVFAGDVAEPGHPLPKDVKNNIASLAYFMFKNSIDVLITPTPEKIQPMIDINRSIASGLMKRAPAPPPAAQGAMKNPGLAARGKEPVPTQRPESSGGKKDSTDSLI